MLLKYVQLLILTCVILFSDPPRILHVGPDRKVTASLFSQTSFSCEAEGNPPPSIQWLQRLPIHPMAIADGSAEEKVILRGAEPRLVLSNLTYDHQGEYVCRAANKIAGVERPVQSEPIPVHVKGEQTENGYHGVF
jgi:Immunoglobulin domain